MLKRSFELEEEIKSKGKLSILTGKMVALLFCEASTRTSCSFHTAALKLGADVLNVNWENSSAKKGETIQDTLRTLEQFADCVVMRHPEKGIHEKVEKYLSKPLLNAGDGIGEHPTQALLDIYTIYRELGKIDGLTITLLGDLLNGRTVHSLFQLLKQFNDVKVNLISPENLKFPEYLLENVESQIKVFSSSELIPEIINTSDVLYITRLQRERFTDEKDFLKIKSGYFVNKELVKNSKESLIIMHPLPRVDELSEDLDDNPKSVWFKQVGYGVYLRAALLESVLTDH